MTVGVRHPRTGPGSTRTRPLAVAAVVGVESAQGEVWRAQVTYVSDRLVGLRGWTIVDGRFRDRDTVTLLIGEGDRLVSAKAQVLSAGGSLMRIVRRDAGEEAERRLAPRLRVDLAATVTLGAADSGLVSLETDVVDLSSSGCAVRTTTPLAVGTPTVVDLELGGTAVRFEGVVVRTWMNEAVPNAGVQFEPMPTATTQLLNRFLVAQLQNAR